LTCAGGIVLIPLARPRFKACRSIGPT